VGVGTGGAKKRGKRLPDTGPWGNGVENGPAGYGGGRGWVAPLQDGCARKRKGLEKSPLWQKKVTGKEAADRKNSLKKGKRVLVKGAFAGRKKLNQKKKEAGHNGGEPAVAEKTGPKVNRGRKFALHAGGSGEPGVNPEGTN